MKKMVKKVISVMLAIALAVSGITYTKSVEAATDIEAWKANAVSVPAEGKLIGAGYIDVEFDNSLDGYTYTVYLDGKPVYWNGDDIVRTDIGETVTSDSVIKSFTSADSGKTEVYTTTVSKHEITVKATDGTNTYTSAPRTFYVSKKGMATSEKMIANIRLKDLNCSWYYNWGTEAINNSSDEGVSFAPMMWGAGEDNLEVMKNFSTDSNYILGFNEPDIDSQANLFFYDGINVWNEYIAPLNIRKVAPAPAAPGGDSSWLKSFMLGDEICKNPFHQDQWDYFRKFDDNDFAKSTYAKVNGVLNDDNKQNDVDAVVLHYYMMTINLDGLKKAVETLWNAYHIPVWVTEIGVFGSKNSTVDHSYEIPEQREQVAEYVKGVVEALDSYPYVERYCWFSYDVESANDVDTFDGGGATAMFEYASGLYTELGKLYSSIGNPEGYDAVNIQDTPDFVWEDRVRTEVNYDSNKDAVSISWNSGKLDVTGYKVLIDDVEYDVENGGSIDTSSFEDGRHTVQVVLYGAGEKVLYDKERSFTISRAEETSTSVEETSTSVEETTTIKKDLQTTTGSKETTTSVKTQKPNKVKLSGAKNVKKKSVKLTWKKISGATKYQIQYALNKKFTKKLKSKTTTKTTLKVTKLKKKKTYYFRVRAVNKAGNGAWSNVKKAKVKK